MADNRLPDVVPAVDLATSKETVVVGVAGQGQTPSSDTCDSSVGREPWQHMTIFNQDNPGDTPIVQIWPDTGSSPDSPITVHPLGKGEDEDEDEEVSRRDQHRSASQLSGSANDSGIDSQLASPIVSNVDGNNKLQPEQSFVLDLSATHLSVPSRLRPGSLQCSSSLDSKQPPTEDEPSEVENSIEIIHGTDPSAVPSSSPGFLPQKRHHRNFLPVDYGSDGCWQSRSDNFQKIRSLPSESEQQQLEMEENTRLAASWSESTSVPITTKTSPQICVQREFSERNSDRSLFDGQSVVSERSSYDSDESSHFLADPETDLGSYPSSRKPSFSSVRSESGTENVDRRKAGAKHNLSSRQQSGCVSMLSRSSSSRSTFLSVPTRVPNSLWLSPASDQTENNKQSRLLQPSLQSQMGSMSSLMASHLSLSNPYLRLCLTEGGINDAMLVSMATADQTGRYTVDMFDDPYYDEAAAAAIQLSLTQRLAFPQLVESDPEAGSSKPNSRYQQRNELPREESGLNFFAKIITFLVLVFVIVLVVGVLVKISHPPR